MKNDASGPLKNRKAQVVGIANDHSIRIYLTYIIGKCQYYNQIHIYLEVFGRRCGFNV